jgi:hypothetical protein
MSAVEISYLPSQLFRREARLQLELIAAVGLRLVLRENK